MIVKSWMAAVLFHRVDPIVVASSGRAGSTLLARAIATGLVQNRFNVSADSWLGQRLIRAANTYSRNLTHIANSSIPVHKTHCLRPKEVPPRARLVFVFCDPLDAALSVQAISLKRGMDWFKRHQCHLQAKGAFEDILTKDVLGYEQQIESWLGGSSNDVLALRYEQLWDQAGMLSEYLGFEVQLPEKRPRVEKAVSAQINEALFDRLSALANDRFCRASQLKKHPVSPLFRS